MCKYNHITAISLFRLTIFALLTIYDTRISFALDLSLTARAEAGLDPATQEFIKTLPATWTPQIATIVDNTMTRVDRSVKTYLSQIDDLLTKEMADVQCHVIATEKSVVDDITKRFPWVSQSGPLVSYGNQIATANATRHYDSNPKYVMSMYSDLTLAGTIAQCRFVNVPTAQTQLAKIISGLNRRWLVWNRADTVGCSTAQDCPSKYKDMLAVVVGQSDQRDVDSSGAKTALAAVTIPAPLGAIDRAISPGKNFDEIEKSMTALFTLENSLGSARALRENAAIIQFEQGKGVADTAFKAIDGLRARVAQIEMRPPTFSRGPYSLLIPTSFPVPCANQFPGLLAQLKAAGNSLEQARAKITAASATSNYVATDANAEIAQIDQQKKRTNDQGAFCNKH